MTGRQAQRIDDHEGDVPDGIADIGDATSLTTGGNGNSVEDKRYPYG